MSIEAAKEKDTGSSPTKTTMMMMTMRNNAHDHDENHHCRPSPSHQYWINGGADAEVGPSSNQQVQHHHNTNNNRSSVASAPAAAAAAAAAAAPPTTAFNSKSPGVGKTANMPVFTKAQWRELERQALIYKYMMASVPVPLHLLFPSSSLGNGMNVIRFNNGVGGDPEAGRCRRTDGKKWRCSRDAAPDQKYCERHLHRGRPRSRKPVEPLRNALTTNIKKKSRIELTNQLSFTPYFAPSQPAGNVTNSPFLDIQPRMGEQRCLDLLMEGDSLPMSSSCSSLAHQWQSLMMQQESPQIPKSFTNFFACADDDPHNNTDLISTQKNHNHQTRGFINAWSDRVSPYNNDDQLGISIRDQTGRVQTGLQVPGSGRDHGSSTAGWLTPLYWTPGGPLAEVLRPSTVTSAALDRPSPAAVMDEEYSGGGSSSPPASTTTTVSPQSGFLQKTVGASRPNNPEISLLW